MSDHQENRRVSVHAPGDRITETLQFTGLCAFQSGSWDQDLTAIIPLESDLWTQRWKNSKETEAANADVLYGSFPMHNGIQSHGGPTGEDIKQTQGGSWKQAMKPGYLHTNSICDWLKDALRLDKEGPRHMKANWRSSGIWRWIFFMALGRSTAQHTFTIKKYSDEMTNDKMTSHIFSFHSWSTHSQI